VPPVITLYGSPGSASLAPHILLKEAGAEYDFVVPVRDGPDAGPPQFLAASPHRRVPAMIDGPLLLTESAAICMHLADRYPAAGLGPGPGDPERGVWYRWLVYLCNTVQPALYQHIYPERFVTDPAHAEAAKASADTRLGGLWDWIDSELADREYLVGERFSAPDAYLWMLGRWSRHQDNPAFTRPNVRAFWDRMLERPSLLAVIADEELAWVP
jgi:glutathione S-transferase